MKSIYKLMALILCTSNLMAHSETEGVIQNSDKPAVASDTFIINICRPGAFTKMFANLDFYVNGKSIGEIKNKTNNSFKLNLADKFKVGQESSILAARYYDDFAIIGTASEPGEAFIILRVKSNISDALLQTLGGALTVGAVKSFESGGSKNWDAEIATKEKYSSECSF